jgi:DME family drug/metabolite transporter
MAAYQLCFFAGVARTGVAAGTIVAIGSAPVLAGLLGWLFQKERPDRRWVMATMLAVTGCGLLIASGGEIRIDGWGVLLSLGAGAAYAIYALTSKVLLLDHSPDTVTAVVFALGALFLLPVLLLVDLRWLAGGRGLLVALHLGLVATALAYMLFARGLKSIPVAMAVTLSLAEPVTAALSGFFVLGERVEKAGILGIRLIFAGLILLTLDPKEKSG